MATVLLHTSELGCYSTGALSVTCCFCTVATLPAITTNLVDFFGYAGQNLRKMEGETLQQPARDLDELQNADWVRREGTDRYVSGFQQMSS